MATVNNITNLSIKQISQLKLIKNGDIGTNGKVYMLNDKECLKVFNEQGVYDEEKFKKFTTYEFETAEAPKKLVYISDIFSGYICNFINGPMLCECDDFDFSDVLALYGDFIKKACFETSVRKIFIGDAGCTNILLDRSINQFKMIDLDLWSIQNDIAIHILRKYNFNNLDIAFSRYIFGVLDNYPDFDTDFIDFYESYKKEMEEKHKTKLKTIGDIRNMRFGMMLKNRK